MTVASQLLGSPLSFPFFPEDIYVLKLTCELLGSNFMNPLQKYLLFQLQRLGHSDPLTLSTSMCIAQKMALTTPYPIISVGYGQLQCRNKGVKTPEEPSLYMVVTSTTACLEMLNLRWNWITYISGVQSRHFRGASGTRFTMLSTTGFQVAESWESWIVSESLKYKVFRRSELRFELQHFKFHMNS